MSKSCSILVVEDDAQVAEVLKNILVSEGNAVEIARDGAAMRSKLSAHDIDVVVLDLGLPDSDGLSLAPIAAEDGRAVVLITGHHRFADALAKSAYHFILKPFRVEQLLRAINAAAEQANLGCRVRRRGGEGAS